ncbi:MAG TPA: ABC transporter permease [Vicinamibacterales bacterium]|nr:ABC transporter permease [Vicinamibacterales bacterium]
MSALERLALLAVPRAWRREITAAIEDEEGSRSALWRAVQIARIGGRLRLARGKDGLATSVTTTFRRSFPMRDSLRDVRFAVRGLRRQPWQAAAIVATLAIGIGAGTAMYSVFNSVLLRPLPGVGRPSELVTIRFQPASRQASYWVSYLDYADIRDGTPGLTGLAAATPLAVDLSIPGERDPHRIDAEIVTANYFDVLGVKALPGRTFAPHEERPTADSPVAVISRRLWARLFNRDASAIGRDILINGHAFVIAGVAPEGFQGRSPITVTDIWFPLGAHPQLMPSAGKMTRRNNLFGDAIGRLRPGVTPAIAEAQAVAAANASHDFMGRGGRPLTLQPTVSPGVGHDTGAQIRLTTMFRLVMAGAGLLLLLSCANAANLLLARAAARRREIAVAQAMGATRFRIIRQLLADGVVFAAISGAAGLALAVGLTSLFEGMRLITFLPAVETVAIDRRVVFFTMAVSIGTGLFFSVVPAFASSRVHLTSALKSGQGASRAGRGILRGGLVMVQVAIAVLLVTTAGLLVQTLGNMRSLELGMKADGLTTFSVSPSRHGYDLTRSREYVRQTLRRLAAVPGVESVGFGWTTSLVPTRAEHRFQVQGGDSTPWTVAANQVSSTFFSTVGIPLIAGRAFTPAEAEDAASPTKAEGVAIVSERLAREAFPQGTAIGGRLVMEYPKGQIRQIVGVVGDVRGRRLSEEPEPWIYLPSDEVGSGRVFLRTAMDHSAAAASVRDVVRDLNPLMPPYDLEPFSASLDRVLAEQRVLARLSTLLGVVAALLAAIGIYAMMAGAVGERMREFGIRLALGAHAGSIVRLVVRHVLHVIALGLMTGLLAAWLTTQAIAARLFGVTPLDAWTIGAACVLLSVLSLIATLLPALRATRADPVSAFRAE